MPESASHAERIVHFLLVPSRISKVAIANTFPEITFEHLATGRLACLWIDSAWDVSPAPRLWESVPQELLPFVRLGGLADAEVMEVACKADGTLLLTLSGGRTLKVSGDPVERTIDEPWKLSEVDRNVTDGGALVIALARSGFAVWDPLELRTS